MSHNFEKFFSESHRFSYKDDISHVEEVIFIFYFGFVLSSFYCRFFFLQEEFENLSQTSSSILRESSFNDLSYINNIIDLENKNEDHG